MVDFSTPVNELTYEDAFAELENIIQALETDQSSLDESVRLFERGEALSEHCSSLLAKAELRIQILSGEEPNRLSSLEDEY